MPHSFHYLTGSFHYPVYRWLTVPFEVFFSKDALLMIVIILFILIVGGSFAIFDSTRVFESLIGTVSKRFMHSRYQILANLRRRLSEFVELYN